jgi:hypothetical protein
MSMDKRGEELSELEKSRTTTLSDLADLAHARTQESRSPHDAHLVSFGQRITYTFAIGKEISSVHYDQGRGKVFLKGHNICNTELAEWQVKILRHFRKVLADSSSADSFLAGYSVLLEKILAERSS